jgi:hypothetical protein
MTNPTNPMSPWSQSNPFFQIYVDGSSISEFKICPRRYQLSILGGYQPTVENVNLKFGLLLHRAHELYHHYRYQNINHEDCLRRIVRWAMAETWNKELNLPWTSTHTTKNRYSLIRTIIWYLDNLEFDPLRVIQLNIGKPAVELSFEVPTEYYSKSDELVTYCGHFDRIATLNDEPEPYIVDVKTTGDQLYLSYFNKYTPHNQFSGYSVGGRIAFKLEIRAIIVDAIQVTASLNRFQRGIVERSDYQLREWQDDLSHWLSQMEHCAETQYWPQNDQSCDLYGGCKFRPVCSLKSKSSRQSLLATAYNINHWNPLEKRGDI